MSLWSTEEYNRGYDAFAAGQARMPWESIPWQHGWNDAAKHAKAIKEYRSRRDNPVRGHKP